MEKRKQTLLKSEYRREAVEMIRFLGELSADEQKEMLFFLQCAGPAGRPGRKRCPKTVTMA